MSDVDHHTDLSALTWEEQIIYLLTSIIVAINKLKETIT